MEEEEEAMGESSFTRSIDLEEDEPLLNDSGAEDRVARQEVDGRPLAEVTQDARRRMQDGEREIVLLGDSDGEGDADGQRGREEAADEQGAKEGNERGGAEGESLGATVTVELDASSSPICPVCYEPWKAEGLHRVCCVPCGHVYGRSCLERWLKQSGKNVGKCPQCNKKFRRKEIVNLYAPVIAVPNDDLEKEVHCLEKENMYLKIERNILLEEINKQKEKYDEFELAQPKGSEPSVGNDLSIWLEIDNLTEEVSHLKRLMLQSDEEMREMRRQQDMIMRHLQIGSFGQLPSGTDDDGDDDDDDEDSS